MTTKKKKTTKKTTTKISNISLGPYSPFKTLKAKINYIDRSGAIVSTMFSKEGNAKMTKMVQGIIDILLKNKKPNRKMVVTKLKTEWKEISKSHPEAWDTDVKETVFWFIDSCMEYKGMKETSFKDLK
jgi:hypothetical protein